MMRPPMSGRNAPRRASAAATCNLYASMQASKPVLAGSDVELEDALKRVVTLQIEVNSERLVPGAIVRRLADEHRCARNGREDRVGQGRGTAGRAPIGLQLRVADVADLDRALAALDVEGDGHALDRDHLADQLDEVGHRAAELAGINIEQSLLLLLAGLVIDVDRGTPIALKDIARHVRDTHDGRAGVVNTLDIALVEMPRYDGVAGAVVGILADPARAQHATIADFKKTAFEVICHPCPSIRWSRPIARVCQACRRLKSTTKAVCGKGS